MKTSSYFLISTLLAVLIVSSIALTTIPLFGIFLLAGITILFAILVSIDIYALVSKKILLLGSFIPTIMLIDISLAYKTSIVSMIILYLLLLSASLMYLLQVDRVLHFPHFRPSFYMIHAVAFGLEFGFILSLLFKHAPIENLFSFILAIIGSVIIGITESIYFQFLFQRVLMKIVHPIFAIFATSIMVYLFHFTLTIPSIIAWMLIGGGTALFFMLTDNVYFSILFTITMNIVFFYFTNNFMALTIV